MKTIHQDLMRLFTIKANKYTAHQCILAIRDIDSTLSMHRDKDTAHPYVAKLFLERDAMIERLYKLTK